MASSGLFSRSPGCGQSLPQTSRSGAALTRFFIEEGAEAQDDRGITHPLTVFSGGAAVVPLIRCTKSQSCPSAASNS